MGEAQIFLFFLVVNLGAWAQRFAEGGQGEDMEQEGLAGAKLLWTVPTAAGYLHNSTQQTSRLRSLEGVGSHPVAGDGFQAVLQAAVHAQVANAWE